ncbi:MAG: hypothetical protein HKN29_03320 [Rhodothermales bacterium]|nr:hypothetical protein [Rhodothermales bacterium]
MKRSLFLVLALAMLPATAFSQSKIDADELPGRWKLVIDVESKADESDNAFARAALRAVGGLLDEIDIRFDFQEDGTAQLEVTAFEEEADVDEDEITWEVTRHGGLILGDSDKLDSEDTIFFRDGDVLVAFELNDDGKPGERKNIRLERLDA